MTKLRSWLYVCVREMTRKSMRVRVHYVHKIKNEIAISQITNARTYKQTFVNMHIYKIIYVIYMHDSLCMNEIYIYLCVQI